MDRVRADKFAAEERLEALSSQAISERICLDVALDGFRQLQQESLAIAARWEGSMLALQR